MSSTAQANVDIKVVLLGREYSGKTSLVQRFVYNRFGDDIPYQPTVGTAYTSKSIKTRSGRSVCIGLWDTAGSERYESLSRLYYRGAWAAVICYDVSDSKSFEKAKFWVEELRKQESNCRVFLSGCKKDLCLSVAANAPRSGSDLTSAAGDGALMKRGTDYYAIADYAQEIGARLYETSSKTGENISSLFEQIAEDYSSSSSEAVATYSAARGENLRDAAFHLASESIAQDRSRQKAASSGCCS